MPDPNLISFRRPGIVSYYTQLQQLQPAEAVILQQLEESLPHMTVLDLGVGGGRTTQYLAHRVFDYTGIDYSPEMIQVCEQRFSNRGQRVRFQVCDVRDLSRFLDHSFDLIFFSFNGIDNISHRERLDFFTDVRRIAKPGGYFCFSTHNLQGIIPEFSLGNRLSINPLKSYVNGIMWGFLCFFNRPLTAVTLQDVDYAIIRDESHNFRLRQYYIRPKAQLQQLDQFFTKINVYSWQTGEPIADHELEAQREMWLYYLCRIP